MKNILQHPFSMDCQWWAPIELIRRFLIIVFIIIDPGNLVSIEEKVICRHTHVAATCMYMYTYVATYICITVYVHLRMYRLQYYY